MNDPCSVKSLVKGSKKREKPGKITIKAEMNTRVIQACSFTPEWNRLDTNPTSPCDHPRLECGKRAPIRTNLARCRFPIVENRQTQSLGVDPRTNTAAMSRIGRANSPLHCYNTHAVLYRGTGPQLNDFQDMSEEWPFSKSPGGKNKRWRNISYTSLKSNLTRVKLVKFSDMVVRLVLFVCKWPLAWIT